MKNRILISLIFLFVIFFTSTIFWKVGEYAVLEVHKKLGEQFHGIQYIFKVLTLQSANNKILFCVQGLAILLLIYLWFVFFRKKKIIK